MQPVRLGGYTEGVLFGAAAMAHLEGGTGLEFDIAVEA